MIERTLRLTLCSVIVVLGLSMNRMYAQERDIVYEAEISYAGSTEDTLPFWQTVNRFGVVDTESPSGLLRYAVALPHRDTRPFSYALGLDLVARAGENSSAFFQQFYGEARWRWLALSAGRREVTAGEVHPLSLGSMTLSANAAPITSVNLDVSRFVPVPGTSGFLSFKGRLSHGWMGGDRFVDDVWLHDKNLYVRLGMPDWPVEGRAGIMHYVMWGGRLVRANSVDPLPSSFNDFLRVFFVQGAPEDFMFQGEVTNVLGNSLGAYDFSLRLFGARMDVLLYRQFFLEDTVSLAFRNGWDGLWGVGLTFKNQRWIEELLWEHVNTKRQSSKSDEPRGTDNYYNHGLYITGWTHRGRTLGMPLAFTDPGFEGVINNIIVGHHVGIQGLLGQTVAYTAFFTYSRNYGAHSIQEVETNIRIRDARFDGPVHRYSIMLEGTSTIFPKLGIDAFARIGYDWGDEELGPARNLGVTLGVIRQGIL